MRNAVFFVTALKVIYSRSISLVDLILHYLMILCNFRFRIYITSDYVSFKLITKLHNLIFIVNEIKEVSKEKLASELSVVNVSLPDAGLCFS